MRWWVPALVAGSLLAGCQSEDESYYTAPKALDKMTLEEQCGFYNKYMSNPDLSAEAKGVALQRMRAKGCTPAKQG